MLRSSDVDAARALLHAAAALALGACVYSFLRDAPPALPQLLHYPVHAARRFAAVTGALPTFAHVWAMTCLTAAVAGRHSRTAAWAGVAWAAIDIAFELGQLPRIAAQLAAWCAPLAGVGPIDRFVSFFLHGTFDPLDLTAAVAGGGLVSRWIVRSREPAHA